MKPLLFLCVLALLAACGPNPTPPDAAGAGSMAFSAADFANGAAIPRMFTCQGDDTAPALAWSGVPEGTKSLALVMDDPDAPGGTWVHWVVINLPPDSTGIQSAAALPPGSRHGTNSWNNAGYGGPCPPSGEHRYFFRLYALDIVLEDQPVDTAALYQAIEGHILAQAEMMGRYRKE